jgi:hypothetical protein
MTPKEIEVVRDALTDAVRIANDLSDALRAVAVASEMGVEALGRIEIDLLAVADLTTEN